MSANLGSTDITKLKGRIFEVQALIAKHGLIYAEKLHSRSSQLSMRSWQHALKELEAEMAHAIWWEGLCPSDRINWAHERIREVSSLFESGTVTTQYQMPTVLEIPLDDPRQLAWAKGLWTSKIEDLRAIIAIETSRLLE